MKPDDKRGGLEGSGDTRRSPCAPKDSLSSSALPARQLVDQLEKLIEKWRAKAQRDSKRQYNHLEWQAVAVEVAHCADELETIALAALLDPAPPETNAEELDSRVDGERLSEATGSTAKITNGDK